MYSKITYKVAARNLGDAMAAIKLVSSHEPEWMNRQEFAPHHDGQDSFIFTVYCAGKVRDAELAVLEMYGIIVGVANA